MQHYTIYLAGITACVPATRGHPFNCTTISRPGVKKGQQPQMVDRKPSLSELKRTARGHLL
jgi:hypothetical protein